MGSSPIIRSNLTFNSYYARVLLTLEESNMTPKYRWKVIIIESERGWGQKVDDVKFFDNEEEADEFVKEYNKDNDETVAPDWYMVAQEPERVMVDA